MTVPHGDIAQTASTYGTGNGGVAQNGHDGNGPAQYQRGLGLRQVNLADDLEGGCAHGLGGLHHTGVHLCQRGFHHAGNKGSRRNHQRHDGASDADLGARNQLGEGHDGHHQDDEGNGAADVDDPAQNPVHQLVGANAVGLGNGEGHAQRQSQNIGKQRGDNHHQQGVPGTGQQNPTVIGKERRNGIKHGTQPPPQ